MDVDRTSVTATSTAILLRADLYNLRPTPEQVAQPVKQRTLSCDRFSRHANCPSKILLPNDCSRGNSKIPKQNILCLSFRSFLVDCRDQYHC